LPAQLAPGAQIMVIGLHPSRWLDDLLATPGIDQAALEQSTLIEWLSSQGLSVSAPIELEESGAYLLHAQQTEHTDANVQASSTQTLLVANAQQEALAAALAEQLSSHAGHSVWLRISDAAPQTLLNEALADLPETPAALNVLDLRELGSTATSAQTQRCFGAQQWSLALEASGLEAQGSAVTLWLATQGYQRADDAALWGFGRSLANEAVGHSVTLIDLPDTPSAAA
ncbi:MAG TPA: hypothetical protein DCX04_01845, partial [Halomonas sp.]|nr:hypothetical protein [Halomonas sp.]